MWFDSLFGQDRAYEEYDQTFGWIQTRIEWDEKDGVEPGLRFRAKYNLPQLEGRLSAVFGRSGGEAFEGDEPGQADELPETFRATDDEWILGLGYSPVRGPRRRFDVTGGIRLESIINPFLEGRYRRQFFLSQRNLVRVRQSVFWELDDGYGVGSRVDYEHILGRRTLFRWLNRGILAQRIDGVRWLSEVTVFRRLGTRGEAIAYRLELRGETEAEVAIERLTARTIYRRPLRGERLYLELRPGIEWRREHPEEERQPYFQLSVGLELRFGDKLGAEGGSG